MDVREANVVLTTRRELVTDEQHLDAVAAYNAEVRRLRAVEQRVERLLTACKENETHVRANVPHLPPEGGSFTVHVIRRFLIGSATTDGDA